MNTSTFRSHLDIDGFMLVKPDTKDLWRRMTKRGLEPIDGADKTIMAIEGSSDFLVASVLTARPKKRGSQTIKTLSGHFPNFEHLEDRLQFVGGTRWPYRAKVDTVARDQQSDSQFGGSIGVLFDDSVAKSANAISERLRSTPEGQFSPAGIALVGFGVNFEQLRSIAIAEAGRIGPEISVVGTPIQDVIGIANRHGEVAYATSMPTHAPDDLARAMDALRGIQGQAA